jgi:hypothetical protein
VFEYADGVALRPRYPTARYKVDIDVERGERVFTVVAPSGARLYSYADARTAEAEAMVLNGGAVTAPARSA